MRRSEELAAFVDTVKHRGQHKILGPVKVPSLDHIDPDAGKNRVFEAWKSNILDDPEMVYRRDPRWQTWLKLRLAALAGAGEGEARSGGDIGDVAIQKKGAAVAGADGDEEEQKSSNAVHPRSAIALSVAMTSGLCLLYTVVFAPYTLAFYWFAELCEGTPFDTLDQVVETIFLLEILFTFFIGRYKNGEYIGNLYGVAADYFWSGQLAFDLLTSIPIAWFEYSQRTACPAPGADIRDLEGVESSGGDIASILRSAQRAQNRSKKSLKRALHHPHKDATNACEPRVS